MLTTTPAGWWLPSPNSATRIPSPNSVSSLISTANPGAAGVLVCFVVRAICWSPCTTVHHSEAENDQGNSARQVAIFIGTFSKRCGVVVNAGSRRARGGYSPNRDGPEKRVQRMTLNLAETYAPYPRDPSVVRQKSC